MRREKSLGFDVIVLSRRNLLALLAKLDGHPPYAVCQLVGGNEARGVMVRAEEDDVHYADRPAGRMHPETERAMRP